jgi:hypothetical protein
MSGKNPKFGISGNMHEMSKSDQSSIMDEGTVGQGGIVKRLIIAAAVLGIGIIIWVGENRVEAARSRSRTYPVTVTATSNGVSKSTVVQVTIKER